MIKVVHLISGLATGGTEMMLFKLLRGMQGGPVENRVVSLTAGGAVAERIRDLGLPVTSLNMRRGAASPAGLWRLLRLLREVRPDVLQTWLYHADLLGLIAARAAGVPALAWNIRCSKMDARYERGLGGMIVRVLAGVSKAPNVVVVNSEAGIAVHRAIGYAPRAWRMIPNGFELERYGPDEHAYREMRGELGLRADTPLVGLVARYDPVKDQATFLRAAALVAARHADVRFLLVGAGVDRANTELASLIGSLGMSNRVLLLGERTDIPRLTAGLDVAACSSRGEGFPNVVGEAMASGVPVVATDVGDVATVLGECGIIVPVADPSSFAAGVCRLLELPPAERRQWGERARARVAAHYDLRSVVAQYAELYRTLAPRPSGLSSVN